MQLPTLKVALADGLEAKIHSEPAQGTAIKVGFVLNQKEYSHIVFGLGSYTFLVTNRQRAHLYKYRNNIKSEDSLMPFTQMLCESEELTAHKGRWSTSSGYAFILAIVRIASSTIPDIDDFSIHATPEIEKGYCTLEPDTRLLVILEDDVQLVTAEYLFSREDIKILNINEGIATIILDYLEDLNRLTFEYGVGFKYDCTGLEKLNLGSSPDICVTEYHNCDAIKELHQCRYNNLARYIDLSASPLQRLPSCIFAHSQLERIDLPKGIVDIPAMTFFRCRELKYIDLPESLTCLAMGAFQESGLQLLVVPKSVTSIDVSRFYLPDLRTLVILGSDITWSYDNSIMTPNNKVILLTIGIPELIKLDNAVNGVLDLMPHLKYINNKPVEYYQSEDYAANLLLNGYGSLIWHSDN